MIYSLIKVCCTNGTLRGFCKMKMFGITEFKRNMNSLLAEVYEDGEYIVITKNDTPVATVNPYEDATTEELQKDIIEYTLTICS